MTVDFFLRALGPLICAMNDSLKNFVSIVIAPRGGVSIGIITVGAVGMGLINACLVGCGLIVFGIKVMGLS